MPWPLRRPARSDPVASVARVAGRRVSAQDDADPAGGSAGSGTRAGLLMQLNQGTIQSYSWLRVFLAVAESRSFTSAAEAMGLSQPTASQQVRLLEDWLGVKLFIRHGRGVTLTDAGAQLHQTAGSALAQVDAALLEVSEKTGVTRGTVRLASVHTINAYLLPQVIADFTDQRPDVTLRVLCRGSSEVVALVERDQADIGLVYDAMVASAAVEITPLFEERMALYLPRDRIAPVPDGLIMVDSSLRLITFPHGFALRQLLESHYPGALNIVAEVETLDTMLRLVNAGAGGAILPDCLPLEMLGVANLCRVPLAEPVPARRVVAITRRDGVATGLLSLLGDVVKRHADCLVAQACGGPSASPASGPDAECAR